MARLEAVGAIGSQSNKVEDKKDIDFSGGMFMANAVQPQNSVYADNGANLTPEQKTGSIFC